MQFEYLGMQCYKTRNNEYIYTGNNKIVPFKSDISFEQSAYITYTSFA